MRKPFFIVSGSGFLALAREASYAANAAGLSRLVGAAGEA
jgi:hypothetical protein